MRVAGSLPDINMFLLQLMLEHLTSDPEKKIDGTDLIIYQVCTDLLTDYYTCNKLTKFVSSVTITRYSLDSRSN